MDILELMRSSMQAIRTNKTRSILTTLGIIIGVAAVILLVAIGNGLQSLVTRQFAQLGSNIIFIVPGKVNLRSGPGRPTTFEPKFDFSDIENLRILGAPITDAAGLINKNATAKYRSKTYDVTLNGVDATYTKIRSIKATQGKFITKSMVEQLQRVVVLGPKVATHLFGSTNPIGQMINISNFKFSVVGVTESKGGGFGGGSDQDSFVYIPITTATKILGDKKPGSISIAVQTAADLGRGSTMVKKYFARKGLTQDDYTILEPKEILATITTFLGAVTGALSGIAAISLVVGGIGIANIMLVSVTERTHEIGLRKAMGATQPDILWQFLIEAIVLSAMGGVIGILLGIGLSAIIARFIETTVTWQSVALAFGVSAAVGIVSGFAPALRASRLNPIDALRYE